MQSYMTDAEIGQVIRKERLRRGWTQTELGEKLGVGAAAVNKYETGVVGNIKREMLQKLSVTLDISPSVLIGIERHENKIVITEMDYTRDELAEIEKFLNFVKVRREWGLIKNSNGYGGITKLSGNRRRPFWVRITTGWETTENGKQKQITKTLGYYASRKEAMIALADYNKSPYDLTASGLTFSQVWDIWSPKHFERHKSAAGGLKSAYKKCSSLYDMKMADIKTVHMQDILDGIAHMSEETQIKVKTVFKNSE